VGLSIVATETSALTFIGVPAMAIGTLELDAGGQFVTAGGNCYFAQIAVGYVLARVIVALIFVPHYFNGEVYTPYQLLTRAFGRRPRYLAAGFALFNMCLQAGFRVYVTAIPVMMVMRTLWPGWGIWWSIVLFCGASVLYASAGGVRAVIWTEMLQFFVLFGSGLFVMLYIPTLLHTPGGASGWAALAEVSAAKLAWLNSGVPPGSPGPLAILSSILGGDFNIWMGLIGATFGVMVSHGVDQLNVQRVLACRDARDGRRALLLSAAIIAPQFVVFLLVGAGLYAFYSLNGFDFGGMVPWDPTAVSHAPKADYILPIFIVSHLPPVVRGFVTAGILAAAMSSLASALTAIPSVAIMDLVRPLRGISGRAAGELRLGRLGTLLAGVALAGIAWWAKDAPLIFNMVFQFAGIFAGAKLGALLFALWRKRGHAGPVLGGMIASFVVMAVVVLSSKAGVLRINWPWYPVIGTLICLLVARLLSAGRSPPADRHIDRPAPDEA
jgi:Na+/proline symporter